MLDLFSVLYKRFIKHILILFLCLNSFYNCLVAQSFAMRGGYQIGFTDSKVMNAIVDQYNNTRSWLDRPMPKIKFLDGFHVGLQFTYKIPFELMWVGRYRKISAEGTPSGQAKGVRSLDLQYHGVSFGLIPFRLKKMPIGFGLSLDFNTLRFDTQKTEQPKEILLRQFNFAGSLFMTLQIQIIKRLSIDIRPYVQIPIGRVDIYPVEQKLNPKNTAKQAPEDFQANFLNGGASISIVYTFWEATKKKVKKIISKPLVDRVSPSLFSQDLYSLLLERFDNLVVLGSKQPKQQLAGALDAQLNREQRQVSYVYARKFKIEDAQKNYISLVRRVQKSLKKGSFIVEDQELSGGEYKSTTFYLAQSPSIKVSTLSILYTTSANKTYADVDLVIVYH